MKSCVALFIFRRPQATAQVWEAIRAAQPPVLYVIADGARPDRPGEAEAVAAARRETEQVNWPCRVVRDYADQNMGTHHRIATGISRLFNEVEEAIILEDDCLPHRSFFLYCDQLLERYRDDQRIFAVSGSNLVGPVEFGEASYSFSRNPSNTGWATWRRAWKLYDDHLDGWNRPEVRREILQKHPELRRFLYRISKEVSLGKVQAWDYRWLLSILRHDGLVCIPRSNLVEHLETGDGATHILSGCFSLKGEELYFPLVHPTTVERNRHFDRLSARRSWDVLPFGERVLRRIKIWLGLWRPD